MADARQISVRLAIEGAEQARAQLEAVREAAKKAGEEGAPTAAQLRQWDSLQRSVDGNHAAAARYTETVRRVQAAEQAGLGTAEQRNRVLEQAAVAHQRATTSMVAHAAGVQNYGAALGQAGFQVQDFATQVAMGQNALLSFGVQFAQFAGFFGAGGAVAGAVVTVGVLGAQFLGLAGNAETLDDVIKQVEDSYKRMNDVAERRIKGLEEEAEALNRLTTGYGTLSAAGQRGELLVAQRQQNALDAQGLQIQQQSTSGIREMVNPTAPEYDIQGNALGTRAAQPGSNEANLVVLRQALEAYDAQSRVTAEGQRALAVSFDAAARAGGENASALYRQRDVVLESIPAAARLEEAQRQVAVQTVAVMHAMNLSQSVIDDYIGRFGRLGEEIVRTALVLETLGRITSENPFASLDQEVARTEAQLAALRTGGLEALEATRQRQAVEQAGAAANQRIFEQEMQSLRERGALQAEIQGVRAREEFSAQEQARALREQGVAQAEIARLTSQRLSEALVMAQAEAALHERAAAAAQAAQQRAEAGVRATQALTREQREAEAAAREAERAQRDAARVGEQEAQRQARAFDQAEELARRTATQAITAGRREQDRSQAQAEREAERQAEREQRRQDDVAREWSRGLADATFAGLQAGFGRGESVAQAFARVLGNVVQRALSNVLAEQVFMPIVSGVMGGGGGAAAAGGGGGLGSLLSGAGMLGNASSLFSGGAEMLGFGGLGSVSGMLSAPIFGQAALASATNSALGGMGAGVYGPATASAVGLPGVSFGGALAGIGGGFMIGSTVGGMLAGRSAARQQNAQIGAGIGAVGGFLVGGPFGAVIGGGLGGAAGGLIGPGPKTNAYGFSLNAADGRFNAGGLQTTGDGAGGDQALAQARAVAEQINAFLEANGITVGTGNRVINGRGNSEDQSATFNDALRVFRFSSGKGGTLGRVLQDRGFDSPDALSSAVSFADAYDTLAGIKKPTDQFAQQIEALNKTFEEATKKAKEYGLATDVLTTAQAKAISTVNAQREASILGGLLGQSRILTGFLEGRAAASGSPQTQFAMAQEQYQAALSAARMGTAETADLQRYAAAGNSLLNASSAFYGTGAQAAAIESMVRSQTIALGQTLDLPGFTTDVTGAIERASNRQIDQLQQLNAAVAALREEARAQRLVIERLLAA